MKSPSADGMLSFTRRHDSRGDKNEDCSSDSDAPFHLNDHFFSDSDDNVSNDAIFKYIHSSFDEESANFLRRN